MSEEKKEGNESVAMKAEDGVKRDDYNKVVESHNTIKLEKEKLQKELEDLKKETKAKEEWAEEKSKMQSQINELKEKKENKVAKGVINEETQPKNESSNFKELLDEQIPDAKVDPKKIASNIQRWAHYKSGTTKEYSNDQLGKAISLQATAHSQDPSLIPEYAKKNKGDITL